MAKNIIVLDTCVLLHDPNALYRFAEHDVYIPLAVIDDLDELKKVPATVGWSAREVFRHLNAFDEEQMMSKKGVEANDKGGRLFIFNNETPNAKTDRPNIIRTNSDNAIIESAIALKAANPKRAVRIVTLDTGLRVRAASWGCRAENYRAAMLSEDVYTGVREVPVVETEDWQLLWKSEGVHIDKLSPQLRESVADINPNEFCIFRASEKNMVPTMFQRGVFRALKDEVNYMGITPRNLEQRFAMEALADPEIPMVSLCGSAGTGKTLLTLAVAMDMMADHVYDRIVFIKPLVPVGGRDIGALPGDKYEKIAAWLGPARDNIDQILSHKMRKSGGVSSEDTFKGLVDQGAIEVEAMQFIQGRSITRSVIVVDECQNLTPREARMIVERCADDSKIVLLGDPSQVENNFLDARSCGLAHVINGGKKFEECASVMLTKVERSKLVAVSSSIFSHPSAQRG